VEAMLLQKKKEHKTSASIGLLFFWIAVLIVIGIALSAL